MRAVRMGVMAGLIGAACGGSAWAAPITVGGLALEYVDASSSNTADYAGVGGWYTSGSTANDSKWGLRTDYANNAQGSATAATGSFYESLGYTSENSPVLKTTITGLSDSDTYEVYVHFWDAVDLAAKKWNIRAGLDYPATPLTLYSEPGVTSLTTKTPVQVWTTTPAALSRQSDGATNQLLERVALVGQIKPTGGQIAVYIDDAPPYRLDIDATNNYRTWYDGVSYRVVPEPAGCLMMMAAAPAVLRRSRRR